EAVSGPLHDEQEAQGEQPRGAVVGENVRQADAGGGEDAEGGQVVGPDGGGNPGGQEPEQAALRLGQQERQFTSCRGHSSILRGGKRGTRRRTNTRATSHAGTRTA